MREIENVPKRFDASLESLTERMDQRDGGMDAIRQNGFSETHHHEPEYDRHDALHENAENDELQPKDPEGDQGGPKNLISVGKRSELI